MVNKLCSFHSPDLRQRNRGIFVPQLPTITLGYLYLRLLVFTDQPQTRSYHLDGNVYNRVGVHLPKSNLFLLSFRYPTNSYILHVKSRFLKS